MHVVYTPYIYIYIYCIYIYLHVCFFYIHGPGTRAAPCTPPHAYTYPVGGSGRADGSPPLWVVVVGWVLEESTAEGPGEESMQAYMHVCMRASMHAKTHHT